MRELRPLFQEAEQFVERVLRSTKKATGSRFLNPKAKFAPSPAIDFSNRFFRESFSMSMIWSRVKATGRVVLGVNCSIG